MLDIFLVSVISRIESIGGGRAGGREVGGGWGAKGGNHLESSNSVVPS